MCCVSSRKAEVLTAVTQTHSQQPGFLEDTVCSPEHRTSRTPSSQDQGTNSADYLYVTCKLLKPFMASGFSYCHSKFNYTRSTYTCVLCSIETLNRVQKLKLKQMSPYSIVQFPS